MMQQQFQQQLLSPLIIEAQQGRYTVTAISVLLMAGTDCITCGLLTSAAGLTKKYVFRVTSWKKGYS